MPTDPSSSDRYEQLARALGHDLRTPIANILGFADLIRDTPEVTLTAEQIEFLDRIDENCRTLLDTLERLAKLVRTKP